jgi:DNA polymerase epsilon subunit 1
VAASANELRANDANFDLFDDDLRDDERRNNASFAEASDFIVDIREYDVPYHVRVMIDLGKS